MSEPLVKKALESVRGGDVSALVKSLSGDLGGRLKTGLADFGKRFSDLHIDVGDVVTSGDRVGFTYTATATHSGEAYGVKATKKKIKWTGTGVAVVADGKITDLQVRDDGWARRFQLGVLPEITTSGAYNLTGTWTSNYNGICLQATLTQSGNNFSGSACASAGGSQIGATIQLSGTNNTSASPQIVVNGAGFNGNGNWNSGTQFTVQTSGFGSVTFTPGNCGVTCS